MARAEEPIDPEVDAETRTVDRDAEAETVVVERVDRTVVVERGPAPEGTVAITRARPPRDPDAPMLATRGRRRRGMTMPPVPAGYGRGAVDAVGPGARATYEPRPLPGPPPAPPGLGGVEATRVAVPGMPSDTRRARRTGVIALAVFAIACVVSVAGLVALAFATFGQPGGG